MDLSELYRDIVETSPDGIWVIDLDGRTLYANPAIARIHRIPDERAGLPERLRHPRRGRPRAVRRAPRRRPRAGRINAADVEVQWVRSDGDIVWMLLP